MRKFVVPRQLPALLALLCAAFISSAQTNLDGLNILPGGKLTIEKGASFITPLNIRLAKNAQLKNEGLINFVNTKTAVWVDDADPSAAKIEGTISFEGTAPVRLKGNAVFTTMISNGNGIVLDSGSSFKVSGHLVLGKGKIRTNNSLLSVQNPGSDAISFLPGNENYQRSYIDGSLGRIIDNTNKNYFFPIGDSTALQGLRLLVNKMQPVEIAASFTPGAQSDPGIDLHDGIHYSMLASRGRWQIRVSNPQSDANYDLQLSIAGFSGLADNNFGIVERQAAPLNSAWTVPPGTSLPATGAQGRTLAAGYAQRNGFASLSNTDLAIASGVIALPVIMLDFKAARLNAELVELKWRTANEVNNKGFFVERSPNGLTGFSTVSFVPSATSGSSNQSYTGIDANSLAQTTFYRLRQQDINGQVSYSKVLSIPGSQLRFKVSPNPASGPVNIEASGNENLRLFLFNSEGKIVLTKTFRLSTRLNLHAFVNGIYSLQLVNGKNSIVYRQQIILNN